MTVTLDNVSVKDINTLAFALEMLRDFSEDDAPELEGKPDQVDEYNNLLETLDSCNNLLYKLGVVPDVPCEEHGGVVVSN